MQHKERILSLDIFRGLTIFLMVFVNDLAGVSNIPAWMKHVAADVDGMTFVDVVFPAFLFIVGMAIPFAVNNRLSKSPGLIDFWQHVLIRTFGLLVLGVYMVNSGEMNVEATLIPKSLWATSLYVAAILIWNQYPRTEQKSKTRVFLGLRVLGVLLLIALYFFYRKGENDALTGMTPSWWGILGLIGWAYLLAMLVYMLANKNLNRVVGAFLVLLLFLVVLRSDFFHPSLIWFKEQSGHITHTLLVLSGTICSLLLSKDGLTQTPKLKISYILLFGIILGLLGYLTQPFGGISKIGATPSWALYSAAICCIIFSMIYWLVDLKGIKNWANFLKPAGENPLLTYILPPIFYAIVGFSFFPEMLNSGILGFFRAVLFSFFILWVASWLTKKGIKLHL